MKPVDSRSESTSEGFTIVELSIVLLLLGVATAMMFTFLGAATETTSRTASNVQSEADGQLVMRLITSDLRSASSIDASYPTSGTCVSGGTFTATPFSSFKTCIRVTVLRPTTGGELCPKTEVTYGVVGTNLFMDRVEYTGTTVSCNAGSTTTRKVLLTDVLNTASNPLFAYYNRAGADLLAASPPVSPQGASSIKISIAKQYRSRRSDVVNFSDVVALRNKR